MRLASSIEALAVHPRLFHFSDSDAIETFVPRPVQVPAARPEGRDWLNGPLVWAIDEWHQPMYLFPRDCPRILLWRKAGTTQEDMKRYFGQSSARMLAYVESRWLPRIESALLFRYELPADPFESLEDAGMWVSRKAVTPLEKLPVANLPVRLRAEGVEVRPLEVLTSLKTLWDTSLHASGIRLRNAHDWNR